MIIYNMRNRGPLEYDKFILNAFQFHNEISSIEKKLDKNSLVKTQESLTDMYTSYNGRKRSIELGQDERLGYSKDIYLALLNYREN